jgi:hypothetical protein
MAPPLRLAALLLVVFVAVAASSAVRADLVISRADRKVSGLPTPRSPDLWPAAVFSDLTVCVDVLSFLCRLI